MPAGKNIFTPKSILDMERLEQRKSIVSPGLAKEKTAEEVFQSTGTVAFFLLLVLLTLASWFGIVLLCFTGLKYFLS